MKLSVISAALALISVLVLSVPSFAGNLEYAANFQRVSAPDSQPGFTLAGLAQKSAPSESEAAMLARTCAVDPATVTHYGCYFYSEQVRHQNIRQVGLRGGVSEFSNKGAVGVAVVVSW